MEKIFKEMKNLNPIISQAVSAFAPLEKVGEPIKGQEMVSIPLATFQKLLPKISGYEIDGQTILIYTDQEFDFHCDMGSSRFDFLHWLIHEKGLEGICEAEDYLECMGCEGRNELAEEWANLNTDRWEVVEP